MNLKLSNKSHSNQIFILIFSVLIVLFGVLLVTRFVGALGNDVEDRIEEEFLFELKLDYTSIRSEFNSQNVRSYRVPPSVDQITFITPSCILADEYVDAFMEGYFVVLLDAEKQVLEFIELDEFGTSSGCLEIIDKDVVTLALINSRNVITIEYLE